MFLAVLIETVEGGLGHLVVVGFQEVEQKHQTIDFVILSCDYLEDVLEYHVKQVGPLGILFGDEA